MKVCEYSKGKIKNSKTYNIIDEYDLSDEDNTDYNTKLEEYF